MSEARRGARLAGAPSPLVAVGPSAMDGGLFHHVAQDKAAELSCFDVDAPSLPSPEAVAPSNQEPLAVAHDWGALMAALEISHLADALHAEDIKSGVALSQLRVSPAHNARTSGQSHAAASPLAAEPNTKSSRAT